MKTFVVAVVLVMGAFVMNVYAGVDYGQVMERQGQYVMPAENLKGPAIPPTYEMEEFSQVPIIRAEAATFDLPAESFELPSITQLNSYYSYGMKWDASGKILVLTSEGGVIVSATYTYYADTGDIMVSARHPIINVGYFSRPYCGKKNYDKVKKYLTDTVKAAQVMLDSGSAIIGGGTTPEQAQQYITSSKEVLDTPPANPPVLTPNDYTFRGFLGDFWRRVTKTKAAYRVQSTEKTYEFNRKTGYITVIDAAAPGDIRVVKPKDADYKTTANEMKALFTQTVNAAKASSYVAITAKVKLMNSTFVKEINKFIKKR